MSDTARVAELRRRVQADPTSIAFAQLAEELRRAGANDEAVEVCHAGLARHPGYLSARVTLGRALLELGQLDEALGELSTVASAAPDNLAAMRGLAEIHQRRGELEEALDYYRRALDLARHDPELEETVERMEKEVTPPEPAPEAPVSIEALFDFDTLVQQLGAEDAGPPAIPSADEWVLATASLPAESAASVSGEADPLDPLSALEQDLRAREQAQMADGVGDPEGSPPQVLERESPPQASGRESPALVSGRESSPQVLGDEPAPQVADADDPGIAELERWLQAIESERS